MEVASISCCRGGATISSPLTIGYHRSPGYHRCPASVRHRVFLASIALRQADQQGPVWFVEAMFPGYLFTRFVYSKQHRAVESFSRHPGIVRFGDRLATLPENLVVGLQSRVTGMGTITGNGF